MPLTKKEIARLSLLEEKLDKLVLELSGLAEKHRTRVNRAPIPTGELYRDYSLPITLDSASEKLQECVDELKEARTEYADR